MSRKRPVSGAVISRIATPIPATGGVAPIIEMIGDASIVLLGEASHGTQEFYELRAEVTRELVARHGFRAMAIEGDWPDALRVDRYVRGEGTDATADAALGSFERFPRWMWRNREVVAMVEALRAVNAERPAAGRAGFYGLDLYSLDASMRAVVTYLEGIDPAAAARARERFACFDHAGGDPQQYGLAAYRLDRSCEDQVTEQLVEMVGRSTRTKGRTPAGDEWFHAITNAAVVKDAEAYYRTMFLGRNASWNLRDTHMADTLDLLRAHLGSRGAPAKIVVWAHNSHVGDARATWMGDDGQLTLGQLVRQRHPGETFLLGFTTHTGTVQAAYDWDEPGAVERVRASLPGSWEEAMHDTGIPRFAVTSAALADVADGAELLHRAIGVVYRPATERQSHYYFARLADQYDAVVHLDETHAVHPLEPGAAPAPEEAHDAPETYPSGV